MLKGWRPACLGFSEKKNPRTCLSVSLKHGYITLIAKLITPIQGHTVSGVFCIDLEGPFGISLNPGTRCI